VTGFTLIELLIVIAIIAALVSILMPALDGIRYLAKSTTCMSNHRHVLQGLDVYAGEHEEWYPPRFLGVHATDVYYWSNWFEGDQPDPDKDMHEVAETYLGAPDMLWCPLSTSEMHWLVHGVGATWYMNNTAIYAGWWGHTASIASCPSEDKLCLRRGDAPQSCLTGPIVFDRNGYFGSKWEGYHTRNPAYHSAAGEDMPTDAMPTGWPDGHVELMVPTEEFELHHTYDWPGAAFYWPRPRHGE